MLTFGRGAGFSLSNKQKVNSTSSKVVVIIGVDDAMSFVMWVKFFIEQKVVNLPVKSIFKKMGVRPSVVWQDTTSSIRLKVTGKRSSIKRTRHMNIRCFYITNKVKSSDVVIVYHPTGILVGDYLTKPLNEIPFKNHRTTIIGVDDEAIKYYRVKYVNAKVEYQKHIEYERNGASYSSIEIIA